MALKCDHYTLPSCFSSPRTKHNWHFTIRFLIYTAPRNVYLILNYHLFLRQEYFFELLYLSEYDIRMFLFVISLRNGPSIKYVRNQGNGTFKMCPGAYRKRGVSYLTCAYALTLLLLCFCLMVSCFICKILTLSSFSKGMFVRNG